MFFAGSVVLTFFLLFVEFIHAGVYITLPSAYDGCGSLQSDYYFWDELDDPNRAWNEPLNYYSTSSVPKGTYYFYGPNMPAGSQPFYFSDVQQYFCTGLVDEMPLGSYCFYQNIQNSQSCPSGFTEGTRTQDDENTDCTSGPKEDKTTLPKRVNTLFPDGSIDATQWFFCCGSGSPTNSISFDPIRSQLPDTFMLFQKGGSCQVINGRNSVQTGGVTWEDENYDKISTPIQKNNESGTIPDHDFANGNTKYFYCTYGPSFLPFPPTNLQLTQKTSTSVTISWTASLGSGVYYKIITSTTTKKYSSTSTTWNSLSPSTTYTFYIYAGKNNPSGGAETYETVGSSIQFTTCNAGYTGVSCDPVCNPTCIRGTCIAPNQCKCDTGWGGAICNECANGYYPKNGNCLECNCNNHGTCSDGPNGNGSCACSLGYTTLESSSNYCAACSDGYVMQDSNCVQCHPTCQTCVFNSNYCTSCKSGLILQEDNTCKSNCSERTYYSGTCKNCSESCLTCYGGNDNECLSCPDGKLLEYGSCVSNCSDGNYPDSNNICQGCQSPCSTCIGLQNGKCLSCVSPFIQNGTYCISESECTQNGFVDLNRNCQRCESTCLKCYGPNENQCLSCPNESILSNGECLDKCPTGYFSNLTSNMCQSCSDGCSKCFGRNSDECSTCISPLLLNSTSCISSLECSNFGYKANDLCLLCDSSCSKCNGPNPTNCVTCPESKYLFNGECVDECPLGCYLSGNQCQYCTFPCLSCNGQPANCSSCVDNYSLNGTSCISNDQCLLNGFIDDGICIECNSNCPTCYGPSSENCLSCHESNYLLEGKCVESCPLKYYLDNSTSSCEKCHASCLECSGGGINDCLSCNNNFYFYFGQCLVECPVGYYQDSSSSQCNNCPQICLSCSSVSICTSCEAEYSLYEGECLTSCPNGFTSVNGVCSIEKSNQNQNRVGLGVGLTFGFLFLIVIALLIFFFIKRQKKEQNVKVKEINMKAADNYTSGFSQFDNFSSRAVSVYGTESVNSLGQSTLLNTQIDISLPGFLCFDFNESLILGKAVGSGGGGDLYAAELINQSLIDKFKEKHVVVKYVRGISGQTEEKTLQYFHDEIAINWALNFESNVIKMIGYCDNPKCLVTKLYERDLFSLLHDPSQQLGIIRKCTLMLHISKGIQSIHRIKAAHRDIKSRNVLIERGMTENEDDIRAVICDFGLTITSQSRIGRAPQLEALNGLSAPYAAPEVFLNNEKLGQKNDKLGRFGFVTRLGLNVPQLTSMLTTENKEPTNESISIELIQNSQKADVFAFGVVLWEILTRQIPWNKSTYGEIEQSIRSGKRLEMNQANGISTIERTLFQIAQSCWEEDPNQRPTISSVVSKLSSCLAEIQPKSSYL